VDRDCLAKHRIGGYVLLRKIAKGGMSTVWLARPEPAESGQRFAVKIARTDDDGTFARLLTHEAMLHLPLDHPGLVQAVEFGADRQHCFLVTRFVEGPTLQDWWRLSDGESLIARLCSMLKIVDCVAYLHRQHIVHRDLKPSNILVGFDRQPRVIDLGISICVEKEHDHVPCEIGDCFTPSYSAPEQMLGLASTPAADVYSLGLLVFEALTGQLARTVCLPCCGSDVRAASMPIAADVSMRAANSMRSARVPDALVDVVAQAVEQDPADRPPTAEALGYALRRQLMRAFPVHIVAIG
jgi:serine/threonine-protein kinase